MTPIRAAAAAATAAHSRGCMRTGRALFDPADVQRGGGEVDLIPAQVRKFAGPQAVAIGHKDHRGVSVAPSVALGGPKQAFDLGFCQVFGSASAI